MAWLMLPCKSLHRPWSMSHSCALPRAAKASFARGCAFLSGCTMRETCACVCGGDVINNTSKLCETTPLRTVPVANSSEWTRTWSSQGGHQPKISGGPRSRYKVEKRWSTLKRWSMRGGKKVARRGHRWSQTGTAVSDGHPGVELRCPQYKGSANCPGRVSLNTVSARTEEFIGSL